MHAPAFQVADDLTDILTEQRLAAHDTGATHPARSQLVDGRQPLGGAHLVNLLQGDLAIGAAKIAAVGQRQRHLERTLLVQETAHAKLDDRQRMARCPAHRAGTL